MTAINSTYANDHKATIGTGSDGLNSLCLMPYKHMVEHDFRSFTHNKAMRKLRCQIHFEERC